MEEQLTMSHPIGEVSNARPISSEELEAARNLLMGALTKLDHDSNGIRVALTEAISLLGCSRAPVQKFPPLPPFSDGDRNAILRHIRNNLDSSLKVAELCLLVRVSSAHFCRAFKRSFGMPTHLFITHLRLKKAVELIKTTDLTLSDIALSCGFCDQSHMTNLFRRTYGQTPSRFRHGAFTTSEATDSPKGISMNYRTEVAIPCSVRGS